MKAVGLVAGVALAVVGFALASVSVMSMGSTGITVPFALIGLALGIAGVSLSRSSVKSMRRS